MASHCSGALVVVSIRSNSWARSAGVRVKPKTRSRARSSASSRATRCSKTAGGYTASKGCVAPMTKA